jgi:hypothetical protein
MAMAAGRAGPVLSPRRSRTYWQAQVEAHQRSGLSRRAFCQQRRLRPGTFNFWKWKLTREGGLGRRRGRAIAGRSVAAPTFIPIQLAAARAAVTAGQDDGGEIEIALGRDRCVRVRGRVDSAWLVTVLRGVEALGC